MCQAAECAGTHESRPAREMRLGQGDVHGCTNARGAGTLSATAPCVALPPARHGGRRADLHSHVPVRRPRRAPMRTGVRNVRSHRIGVRTAVMPLFPMPSRLRAAKLARTLPRRLCLRPLTRRIRCHRMSELLPSREAVTGFFQSAATWWQLAFLRLALSSPGSARTPSAGDSRPRSSLAPLTASAAPRCAPGCWRSPHCCCGCGCWQPLR